MFGTGAKHEKSDLFNVGQCAQTFKERGNVLIARVEFLFEASFSLFPRVRIHRALYMNEMFRDGIERDYIQFSFPSAFRSMTYIDIPADEVASEFMPLSDDLLQEVWHRFPPRRFFASSHKQQPRDYYAIDVFMVSSEGRSLVVGNARDGFYIEKRPPMEFTQAFQGDSVWFGTDEHGHASREVIIFEEYLAAAKCAEEIAKLK